MNENLKAFIQKATEDDKLCEKLMEMNESMLNEAKHKFIELADEYGYAITEKDIDELYAECTETSEDELMAVAGGSYTTRRPSDGKLVTSCECVVGGGGSKDHLQKTCGCFFGGGGGLTDEGYQLALKGEIGYYPYKGKPRAMVCLGNGRAHIK